MSTSDKSIDEPTADALRHLGVVGFTLAFLVVLTYIVPAFHRFRPWQSGDPWPLSSLATPAEELYAFAGSGNSGEAAEVDQEALSANLGDAVASSLSAEPVPEGPRIEVLPSEYQGIEIHLEDASGEGMRPFYESLLQTAEGGTELTRIAHYGDSSIATDHITYTLRRRLQQRFGDGGHGFVLVARGYLPYRHRDIQHSASDSWMLREITRNHLTSNGHYGFGGIQFRGRPGAWARFGTDDRGPVGGAVSRFEIYYQRHPRGGHIHYRVDQDERTTIETRDPTPSDEIHRIDVPDGPHRLEVRFGGHGQPRIYGVVLEREGPGVVYDSLGLVGARASRLLNYDADHIRTQLESRGSNLVILGFGGNDANDNIQRDRYEAEYREVIQRMRAGREELGCLVFAPLDQGEQDQRGRVQTMSTIPTIVEAQRAAAAAEGCAFFDTWQAMGGDGAVRRWLQSRPRLASSDMRHMTPSGYEVVANLFYKALLEGFARYLEDR
ncbi:MAG: GDSL-type esterase/lipase family protein [Myxococcota bacterium]